MNNAFVLTETLQEETNRDIQPELRKKADELSDIVEALQKIAGSSYWQVLKKHEFDEDLSRLLTELGSEQDPIKIYRLQGEIKRCKKYSLEKLLDQRRKELQVIKSKIHGK